MIAAFSGIFKLEASPVEGQPLQQKEKKRSKRNHQKKIQKSKSLKMYNVGHFDFCTCPSKNVVKHDASGKKEMLDIMLPSCKCLFESIGANLAHTCIQPFLAKSFRSQLMG